MQSPKTIPYSAFFPRMLALSLLFLIISIPITQPMLVQKSDFLFTFYLAGRLVAAGRPMDLYANPTAINMLNSAFNAYAHQAFPTLPPNSTAAFMYPPITAVVFVPFSFLPPPVALLSWQVLSILSFCLCSVLLSRTTGGNGFNSFFSGLLFFPILQNIAIGQLGIVLGLVPLSLGYWLLQRERPIAAGFALSLLFLKPQYLPAALLMALALSLTGRIRCLLALLVGILSLVLVSVQLFGAPLFSCWLCTIKLANKIYVDPHYGTPSHLLGCLGPAVLQLLPVEHRLAAKMAFYPISAMIGLGALLRCRSLIKAAGKQYLLALPFVFAVSILMLPLTMPYLLYYDLSALAIAGLVLYGIERFRLNPAARRDFILAWVFADGYLIAVLALGKQFVQPITLIAFLGLLYFRVLKVSKLWEKGIVLERVSQTN